MYAFFIKIDNKWKFVDFKAHEEHVTEFVEMVTEDIELTKDRDVKTQDYRVFDLGD